jgi:hypothetical protein
MRKLSVLLVALATTTALTGFAPASNAAAPAAARATPAAAAVAAAAPVAAVHPSHGLEPFDMVTVSGTGLPPNISVNIVQCDVPTSAGDEGPIGCDPVQTATTTPGGTLSIQLNVLGEVGREQQRGDPEPIYCRNDQCRYFLEWTGADGFHSIPTPKMVFHGSAATLTATPTDGLVDEQAVHVSGTALGSSGRYVEIDEINCYQFSEGDGCGGQTVLGTLKLNSSGTFSGTVNVYRYLVDGEDCVDAYTGCELRLTVFDVDGQVDTSYAVPADGDKSVGITFTG